MSPIIRVFKSDELAYVVKRAWFLVATALMLVAGFQLARLVFFFQYIEEFRDLPIGELVLAFLVGIRFDVSTATVVSLPVIILVLVPFSGLLKRFFIVLSGVLLIWHVSLLVYSFIDVQYYAFAARHLTFEIANTWHEMDVFVKIGFIDYLFPTLVLLLFLGAYSFGFFLLVRKIGIWRLSRPKGFLRILAAEVAGFIIFIAFSVLVFRGGLQEKALGINDAYFSVNPAVGALSLNGVFTTLDYLNDQAKGFESPVYTEIFGEVQPGDEALVLDKILVKGRETNDPEYPLLRKFNYAPEDALEMNVVMFIMESWSSKYVGALGSDFSVTPNFDALAPKGLLFEKCLAGATRSIQGVPSVLGSLPSWKGLVFGKGGLFYQSRLKPVPRALAERGYTTLFTHGGPPDTIRLEGIVNIMGFQEHMSLKDYPNYKEHYDGIWGVYDDYAFTSVEKKLREINGPFFAVLYSLSSHSPYSVPSDEFNYFGKDVEYGSFLSSFKYSDYALGKFFEQAKDSEYFDNTLFVIVADHTEGRSTASNMFQRFHVPCLFYTPNGVVEPGRIASLVGQIDVMPTIVDILRLDIPFTGWGKSALEPGNRALVLPNGDRFMYVDDERLLYADTEGPIMLVDYEKNPNANLLLNTNDSASKEKALSMFEGMKRYIRFSYDLIESNRVAPPASAR
jgi:phosphoglycerol transferase MdoB-like AlkP superfamily enzyme